MLRSGTQLPVALQPSWLSAWRTLAVGAFSLCWHQVCDMALCVTPLPWLVKHVVGGRKPCSCPWNEHLCVGADGGRWGLEALLRDARGGSQTSVLLWRREGGSSVAFARSLARCSRCGHIELKETRQRTPHLSF